MISWLSAALISISIGIVVSLFDKYTLGRASAGAYLFLIGIVNAFSLLLLPLGIAHTPTSMQWFAGISLGLLFAVIVYSSFRALAQEEVSRLAPLGILSTILISLGSIMFFGDHLSGHQLWAFFLFIAGAVLLATRVVIKVELLDDLTAFRFEKVGKRVQKAASEAWHHPGSVGKSTSNQFFWTMQDIFDAEWMSPVIDYVKYRRKLKLIKGLGWYLLSVGLSVPYILLMKQLNTTAGVATGFMTVRVGLFIGSVLFIIGEWKQVKHFLRQKGLAAATVVKESVSVASGFVWWVAATNGPLSIVQSLGSLQSAGIFILGTVFSYFGILHESLRRRDLLQKGAGVLLIVAATVLLFL